MNPDEVSQAGLKANFTHVFEAVESLGTTFVITRDVRITGAPSQVSRVAVLMPYSEYVKMQSVLRADLNRNDPE
jgi:hypothetical protein